PLIRNTRHASRSPPSGTSPCEAGPAPGMTRSELTLDKSGEHHLTSDERQVELVGVRDPDADSALSAYQTYSPRLRRQPQGISERGQSSPDLRIRTEVRKVSLVLEAVIQPVVLP